MKKFTFSNFISRKLIIAVLLTTTLSFTASAQLFWTEDFGAGCNANQLASAFAGINGGWTVTSTGLNDPEANVWYVSAKEAGMGVGNCGFDGCVGGNTNQTLHVGANNTAFGIFDVGAAYDAGGFCGILYCTETHLRAESPLINCSGQSSITMAFNYLMDGDPGLDYCEIFYSINGGATWLTLGVPPLTPLVASCFIAGTQQGQWTANSIPLPATCNNNANVKIAFNWINNDDGAGTDPSFAIDDITMTTVLNSITCGPVAGPFCACGTMNVPYNALGTYTAANTFSVELSDAAGSFAAPVTIGSILSFFLSGNISCVIPCGTPAGAGYRVRVVSSSPVCVGSDNGVNFTINAAIIPTVSNSASANPICAGASVTFFSGTFTGGTTPTYQWYVNGVAVGGATSANYSTTTIANGDIVSVDMTSNLACASPTTVSSNAIVMVVNTSVVPTVTITASPAGAICAGTSVTFTATNTNGGVPTYDWQINGISTGGTSSTFTSTSLLNNDNVTCVMTSTAPCAIPATVTSNIIVIAVTAAPASVLNSASVSAICPGDPVTFTAAPTNGGVPTYQWFVNGVAVAGATSSTYTTTTVLPGDNVTVVMTSSLACATGSPATSNVVTLTAAGTVTPTATITALPSGAICAGTSVTFSSVITNGGATPTYQWFVNSVPVGGATSTTFTSSTLVNNDTITLGMLSSSSCASPTGAISNQIIITVSPAVVASVSVTASPIGAICAGSSVTFTAAPTNGGTTPTYQWQVNGVNVGGATSATFTSSTLTNGNSVTVIMTSNANCVTGSPATSTAISMVVNPLPTVTVNSITICNGQTATLTAGGATTYTWSAGTVGSGASVTASPTTTTSYTVTGTQAGCTNTAISTVTVSNCVTPVANFSVDDNTFCIPGGCANFTDLSTNTPTSWLWSFGGAVPSTSTAQNPTSICYTTTGSYAVMLIVGNPSGFDTLTMINYINVVEPIPVTITGNTNVNACEKTRLTAQPNGQTYSWGSVLPSTSIDCSTCQSADFSAAATDIVYVNYTDINGCPDGDTVPLNVTKIFKVYMPTAFSPNSDHVNDILKVYGRGISYLTLKVFDRIGEKVWETTDWEEQTDYNPTTKSGWDGRYHGIPMNDNSCVYELEVVYCNGEVYKEHGSVTLVR